MMRWAAIGLGWLLSVTTAFGQAPPPPLVKARSSAATVVHGRTIAYDAEVGLVPVASGPGRSDATAGYVSYRVAGGDRPVLFVFNGGPGAASAYLQMGALGPRRARVPQDPALPLPAAPQVGDNGDTLLDIADLVFLDPPGTGFSAIAPGADTGFYRSVTGDAAALAQAARAWLAAHGRSGAPLYILGESYGTIRAAAMVDALREQDPALKLRGVVLLGQALNMIETSQRPGNVVSCDNSLAAGASLSNVPCR